MIKSEQLLLDELVCKYHFDHTLSSGSGKSDFHSNETWIVITNVFLYFKSHFRIFFRFLE